MIVPAVVYALFFAAIYVVSYFIRRQINFLKKEMADPREPVTAKQHGEQQFPVKGQKKKEKAGERQYGSGEV